MPDASLIVRLPGSGAVSASLSTVVPRLAVGQLLQALVLEIHGARALVRVRGQEFSARAEAPLSAGTVVSLPVTELSDHRLVFRVVSEQPGAGREPPLNEDDLRAVLQSAGLTDGEITRAVARALLVARLPVRRATIQALVDVGQALDDANPQTLRAAAELMRRDLPVTPGTVQIARALTRPAGELGRLLNQLQSLLDRPPDANPLPERVLAVLRRVLAATPRFQPLASANAETDAAGRARPTSPVAPPGSVARTEESGRTGPTSPAASPGSTARAEEPGRTGPTSPATSPGTAARTDATGAANRAPPSEPARATPLPLPAEGRVVNTVVARPSARPAPASPGEGTRAAATPAAPPTGVETTLVSQPVAGADLGDELRRALEVLGSSVERRLLDSVPRGSGVLELRAVLAEAAAVLEDEQVAARDQDVRGVLRQLRALVSELESSFEATRLVNAAPRGDASQNSYLFSVPVQTPTGWTSAELEIFRRADGLPIDPDDFRVAIRLDLPHLKEVKITVSVREQLVSCAFTCAQLDGMHALEQAHAELVQGLHDQGFRTGRFTHALLAAQDTPQESLSVPPGRLDTRA